MNDRLATILWRRLDLPGHEFAQLAQTDEGWRLSGVAVLAESSRPCRMDYTIDCDREWLTRRCVVLSRIASASSTLDIVRNLDGTWTVNGTPSPSLMGCDDIDLGFSPSTNLLPIRRLGLKLGEHESVRAAWVRFPQLSIQVLEQVYTRLAADRYAYESAGGRFRRELTVGETGFVLDYPGIWVAEARAD